MSSNLVIVFVVVLAACSCPKNKQDGIIETTSLINEVNAMRLENGLSHLIYMEKTEHQADRDVMTYATGLSQYKGNPSGIYRIMEIVETGDPKKIIAELAARSEYNRYALFDPDLVSAEAAVYRHHYSREYPNAVIYFVVYRSYFKTASFQPKIERLD